MNNVMEGIRTYIEKDYAAQGKDEKYLLGIIRNSENRKQVFHTTVPPTVRVSKCSSCGRDVLDGERIGQGCIACAPATAAGGRP